MKAYKAFRPDWKCRDMQYKVGETYTHDGKVEICNSGFHACENPLDVLNYYDLTNCKIAEVELTGAVVKHDEDSKVAAASISVKAELDLAGFIEASFAFAWAACKAKINKEHGAQLAASGNYAQLAASGDGAKLAASGARSVIASSSTDARAKGAVGTWISLAEFDVKGACIGFATGCIGKGRLKADTWYRAKGGKLVEAKDG